MTEKEMKIDELSEEAIEELCGDGREFDEDGEK